MAASHTTNLELNKPARTDFVSVITDINDNMDMIDAAIGALPSGKTVQGQIDELGTDKVPATRTVNGKALSSDVTLYGSDIEMNSGDSTKVDAAITALQGDVADLQETDEANYVKLDGIKANSGNLYLYKEASGDVVDVYDAVAEAVKQMQIEIAPLQDLHGYDHPWVGGAGHNLINWSINTYQNCEEITLNAGNYVLSAASTLLEGVWYIRGLKSNNTYCSKQEMGVDSFNKSSVATEDIYYGGSSLQTLAFTCPENGVKFRFGKSNADGTIPAMLNTGTTALPYEPYSNICPITGWTGAKVSRSKNANMLFGVSATEGKYINGSGAEGTDPTFCYTDLIPVEVGKTYYVQGHSPLTTAANVRVHSYSSSGVWTSQLTYKNVGGDSDYSISVTVPSGVSYIKISHPMNDFAYLGTDERIAYSITFPSSAGTVYGGTLTVNQDGTGTLVVDKEGNDIGSLSWEYNSTYSVFQVVVSGKTGTAGDESGIISSCYKARPYGNNASFSTEDGIIFMHTNGSIRIRDSRYTDATSFKTALTGQTLVYPLATPVTYTLTTSQVLHLLSGYNTVYADCGDITILYPSDAHQTVEQAEKERIHQSITTSASVQTFADGADNVPMGMKVAVEPIQDLHGQTSPWVGGAGKNLLPLSTSVVKSKNTGGTWNGNTYTWKNVAFTLNEDNAGNLVSISVNGTANANSTTNLIGSHTSPYTGLTAGSYTLSKGNTNSNVMVSVDMYNGTTWIKQTVASGSDNVPLTIDYDGYDGIVVSIYVPNGANVDQILYPMIRLSSVSDDTFAPYSNICPISGWNKAEVTRTGKNLIPYIQEGTINQTTGKDSTVDTSVIRSGYILVKPSTTYTFSGASGSIRFLQINDKDAVVNNEVISVSTSAQMTTVETAKYIRFQANKTVVALTASVMLEECSTATTYVPYQGTTYTIPFNTDCYGGYFTIGKDGEVELTATSAMVVLDGTGTYGIQSSKYCYYEIDSMKRIQDYSVIKCDKLKSVTNHIDMLNNNNFGITGYYNTTQYAGQNWFYFYIDGLTTTNAYKDWMAEHKPVVVYPLATPVSVRLNQCTIRSLLGTNNVWSDTGNVQEIQYSADTKSYIDNLFATIINATGVSF